jgi:hypothetical protein
MEPPIRDCVIDPGRREFKRAAGTTSIGAFMQRFGFLDKYPRQIQWCLKVAAKSSGSSAGTLSSADTTDVVGTEIGTERRIHMRKISLFAAAALILTGIGSWAASTTKARVDIPVKAGLDPSQMMMNGPDLPTEHYEDYSFVFN